LKRSWKELGKILERSWKDLGKILEKSWKNLGKILERKLAHSLFSNLSEMAPRSS
jgi:hypothetical protein